MKTLMIGNEDSSLVNGLFWGDAGGILLSSATQMAHLIFGGQLHIHTHTHTHIYIYIYIYIYMYMYIHVDV